MLLLKKHLVLLVRQGLKRQTIRLWSRPIVRPNAISHTPGLGKMRITAVDILPSLDALTEADAHADGFPNRATLLEEIHKIYGQHLPPDRKIFRIKFDWPIDDPGRKLQLKPEPSPATSSATNTTTKKRPAKKQHPHQAPNAYLPQQMVSKNKSRTHMTPTQRHTLRDYLITRKPPTKNPRTTKH